MEEKPKNFKACDLCGAQAIFLCLECLANYYCDSCYKLIHDKKEKNNHKKEKLDYFIPIDTRCPKHPKVSLNLFCLDEKGNIQIYNYQLNK